MNDGAGPDRRRFVAGCLCVGCSGFLGAAEPSARNVKRLKDAAAQGDGGASGLSEKMAGGKKSFDIAYCGIYCSACALHLKGGKNGKKCKGCTHPSMDSKCAVFNCAKEKKVSNCGLCPQFESCETLAKHHEKPLYRQVARRTCVKVKSDGMDRVIAEQNARWTCKACGKLFPWNTTGACPHCGKPVDVMSEKDA